VVPVIGVVSATWRTVLVVMAARASALVTPTADGDAGSVAPPGLPTSANAIAAPDPG